jgi:hypothetical protein
VRVVLTSTRSNSPLKLSQDKSQQLPRREFTTPIGSEQLPLPWLFSFIA